MVPGATTIDADIDRALSGQSDGMVFPFSFTLPADGSVIGSTRFWKIDHENRPLQIGHAWYASTWQWTAANTKCKFQMRRYAFDQLRCARVPFTTDILNKRSRAAILRLGAVEEGMSIDEVAINALVRAVARLNPSSKP